MRTTRIVGLGLLFMGMASFAHAEEVVWRPTVRTANTPTSSTSAAVTLRRPIPLHPVAGSAEQFVGGSEAALRPLVRAQAPGGPVPPVPPPPPPPPPAFGSGGAAPITDEQLNCGVATTSPTAHPFLESGLGFFEGICGAVQGCFVPTDGRKAFRSDHCFDGFASPVTNPFYFEDPRALTEIRPIYIHQEAPRGNAIFHGADIDFAGVQARLAVTERFSLVMQQLGWIWMEVPSPTGDFHSHDGFTQTDLGVKYTFIRNEKSGSLLAGGLTFELPSGPSKVFQDTGTLGLRPYFSFGQQFLSSTYGTFHFLNTTGYDFGVDNVRTDFFFSSFHLDYGILNVIYPFVEMNWFLYTRNGNRENINFEGRDLFNFGAQQVAGHNNLSLSFGARYKFTEAIQLGAAYTFPLVNPKDLLDYRLTFDIIFRY